MVRRSRLLGVSAMNVRLSRIDLDDLDLGRRDLDLGTVQGRLTFSLFDESGALRPMTPSASGSMRSSKRS